MSRISKISDQSTNSSQEELLNKIFSVDLDDLVFEKEKFEADKKGKIFPDPVKIANHAKTHDSQFHSPKEAVVVVHYNTNIYGEDNLNLIVERLNSKEEIDKQESLKKIKKETRSLSKHRAITLPVTADAVCDGNKLPNTYEYLLTVVNAPNAGNSKKGTGIPSSHIDIQNYFSQPDCEEYKLAMKEIYKTIMRAQIDSQIIVIPPLGLGVYISALEGRDIYNLYDFNEVEVKKHTNDFVYVNRLKKLYFVHADGRYEDIREKMRPSQIENMAKYIRDNDEHHYGMVHLPPYKSNDFGLKEFINKLPPKIDRPSVETIQEKNYEALREVIEEFNSVKSTAIEVIILAATRETGKQVFKDYISKEISVLLTPGDMLQTIAMLTNLGLKVGAVCPGSDHDIGGAAYEALVKVIPRLPAEELIALTSNFTSSLQKALLEQRIKFVPYSELVAKSVLESLGAIKASNIPMELDDTKKSNYTADNIKMTLLAPQKKMSEDEMKIDEANKKNALSFNC